MVVRMIEILLEYLSIILYIHKVAKKNVNFNVWITGLGLFNLILLLCISYRGVPGYFRVLIYICLFLYVKKKIFSAWDKAVKVYVGMLICVVLLQIVIYFVFKMLRLDVLNTQYGGVFINATICCILYGWKQKRLVAICKKIKPIKGIIIVLLFLMSLFYFLQIYNNGKYMNFDMAMQFVLGTIGFSIVSNLWLNAENESKHREKELQIYESYSIAFEDAIKTIRIRQHEFENHINAIRCMQYTIKDYQKLVCEQEEYCNSVLEKNSLNKLLSLNMEPILIGFMYSKITMANEMDIRVEYDIRFEQEECNVELYELIEILGILFDNAVEALEKHEGNKWILIKIEAERSNVYVEIANTSRIYQNIEIERFCTYGFSTKGEKRGIGLSRVKEILEKYELALQIENMIYMEQNCLSFKIVSNE